MKHRVKLELTAIFVMGALLILSLAGLAGKTLETSSIMAYPSLQTARPGEFIKPQQKTVYFTFDDGPSSKNTVKVLDMLAKQDVKATFFVTGQKAEEAYAPELLHRIVDEGHALGLHSYTHKFASIYATPDNYLADLDRLNNYLYDVVGVRPSIVRFPGGSGTINATRANMKAMIEMLTERGYLYYDWDVVSGDDAPTTQPAEVLCKRIVDGVQGKEQAVILLHDNPAAKTSAEAVNQAINTLREQGYCFDKLSPEVEPVHIKTNRH